METLEKKKSRKKETRIGAANVAAEKYSAWYLVKNAELQETLKEKGMLTKDLESFVQSKKRVIIELERVS